MFVASSNSFGSYNSNIEKMQKIGAVKRRLFDNEEDVKPKRTRYERFVAIYKHSIPLKLHEFIFRFHFSHVDNNGHQSLEGEQTAGTVQYADQYYYVTTDEPTQFYYVQQQDTNQVNHYYNDAPSQIFCVPYDSEATVTQVADNQFVYIEKSYTTIIDNSITAGNDVMESSSDSYDDDDKEVEFYMEIHQNRHFTRIRDDCEEGLNS